jgi:hypothetical protein
MLTEQHSNLVEFIWCIAEHLRGPYRPPQYRKVILSTLHGIGVNILVPDTPSKSEIFLPAISRTEADWQSTTSVAAVVRPFK